MSLSRLAVRLTTVHALMNATLAQGRVFDSAVQSIDQMAKQNREPFIVVMTDDHLADGVGIDMRLGNDSLDLVIEIAVAQRIQTQVPTGNGSATAVAIPHTDAGMEVAIDVICQQITDLLMGGKSPWQALWRQLVFRVNKVASRRGAAADDGTRFAARQMIITCDILSSPVRGAPLLPTSSFGKFLAAMEADPEQIGMAKLVRYAVEGDAPLPDEDVIASTLGISPRTVDFMGLAPIRDDAGNAVLVSEVDVDVAGQADSPWAMTETEADEQGV